MNMPVSFAQFRLRDITDEPLFADGTTVEAKHKVNTAHAKLYRAALYVSLENFSKAEIYHRLYPYHSGTILATYLRSGRILYDATKFSNPVVAFETVGRETSPGTETRWIADMGVSDDSTTGSPIGNPVDFVSATKTRIRTAPFTLVTGSNYAVYVDSGSGSTRAQTSFFVINVTRNP
jgi:hypothetical protein